VWDSEGNNGAQLGMTYSGGEVAGYFAFDQVAAKQENIDGNPSVEGDTVNGVFPAPDYEIGQWSAGLSLDTKDVAGCPDRNYSLQPFPS
jgi:hypothetical protein